MPWRQAQQPFPELGITRYLHAQSKHTPSVTRSLLGIVTRQPQTAPNAVVLVLTSAMETMPSPWRPKPSPITPFRSLPLSCAPARAVRATEVQKRPTKCCRDRFTELPASRVGALWEVRVGYLEVGEGDGDDAGGRRPLLHREVGRPAGPGSICLRRAAAVARGESAGGLAGLCLCLSRFPGGNLRGSSFSLKKKGRVALVDVGER